MISPSQYEQFHEWLNQCPTEILQYIDNTDNIVVTIAQPSYEEEKEWLRNYSFQNMHMIN